MKSHETISNALGIDYKPEVPLPVKVEPAPVVAKDNIAEDQAEDYNLSRRTFRSLIKKGEEAIDELYDLAKNSETPRSYEVLATLMRTVADTTKDLYDLQKKTQDLKGHKKEENGITTNIMADKAVFVGTTAELLQKIRNNKDENI